VNKLSKLAIIITLMSEYPNAKFPEYANEGDFGADLFSGEVEAIVIPPHMRKGIHTGVKCIFPEGWGGIFKEKSGLALKQGVAILGGVIDNGYRGELIVIVHNTSHHAIKIEPGQKLCQMVLQQVQQAEFISGEVTADTARGTGGFGSSGTGTEKTNG
jgi:dUTP pyrophosphatase